MVHFDFTPDIFCQTNQTKSSKLYACPKGRTVDVTVDTARVLALLSAMLFPAPLVQDEEIVIDVGQSASASFPPDLANHS